MLYIYIFLIYYLTKYTFIIIFHLSAFLKLFLFFLLTYILFCYLFAIKKIDNFEGKKKELSNFWTNIN